MTQPVSPSSDNFLQSFQSALIVGDVRKAKLAFISLRNADSQISEKSLNIIKNALSTSDLRTAYLEIQKIKTARLPPDALSGAPSDPAYVSAMSDLISKLDQFGVSDNKAIFALNTFSESVSVIKAGTLYGKSGNTVAPKLNIHVVA